MTTTELIDMLPNLSAAITEDRGKAFCTLAQKEALEKDLFINQILLQLVFEELNFKRTLTDEEAEKLNYLMNQRVD